MREYTKFWTALGGFCAVVASVASDGLMTTNDWLAVAVALLTALGVRQFANKK